MKCPKCLFFTTKQVDKRLRGERFHIRRKCLDCKHRWTTEETA